MSGPGQGDRPGTGPRASGRREDARLVTGRARFTTDRAGPDTLVAAFARSYLAHGVVGSVGLDAVRRSPGIVAAFAAEDLDLPDIPGSTNLGGPAAPGMTRPPLARERVRYVGEPLALVVGTTREAVADALELVELELTPVPVVADAAAAIGDEVLVHPAAGTNVVAQLRSAAEDVPEPDLDRWPVRVEVEVEHPRLAPVPLEPLGMLAAPVEAAPGDGGLVLHVGHQAPHRLRGQLAALLGMPPEAIRVVVPDTGGAFGMRGMLFPEYVAVAAAARRLGRAVHWTESRTEQFLGGTHGRAMTHRVRLAGTPDGRIHAARVELLAEVGAYPHNGSHVPTFTQYLAQGAYDIAEVLATTTIVVTNRAPTGSYRGAGRPEASYAIERAVEAYARALGQDPVEVRRRNLVAAAAMPYRTATGALYDSGDYTAALDELCRLLDIDALRAEQRARRAAGEDPLGIGVAVFVERAGGAASSTEFARVEVASDGRVVARVGTASSGQGHETVWARLVADALHLDDAAVEVVTGDTGRVARGVGSFASRSAQIGGAAVHRCAERVRDRSLALAGELLEVDVADLELAGGRVAVRGAPERGVALAELAAVAVERGDALASEEDYTPNAQTFPYGATGAVVEVERDTGRVHLRRIVAVDDCGRVLDEAIVEGQVHGSLVQGIAQALHEEVVYGDDGQPLTTSLLDYTVPAAPDVPAIETGRIVHPAPSNPLGAKGTGESGCLGAPPAVVHAVLDALAPDGVTDLRMPLTPMRVWQALHRAEQRP